MCLRAKSNARQIAPSSSSILLNSANQFTNASGYQHQEPHGVLFLGISHHRPKRTWASIIGSSGSRSVPSSILAWQSQAQCLKFRGRMKLANFHQAQSQSGRHLSKNTGEAAFLGCHHGTVHATGNISAHSPVPDWIASVLFLLACVVSSYVEKPSGPSGTTHKPRHHVWHPGSNSHLPLTFFESLLAFFKRLLGIVACV